MFANQNPKTSFVIPTWNGKHLLEECLPSLKEQRDQDFEVIIVDNGSDDGTIPFLKREYPQIKVINLKEKSGFAVPVNRGAQAAKGQYIVLLNNDVVLDPLWLTNLTKRLDQNKEIGFCACLMLDKDGEKVDSAGDGFSWWGRVYPIGKGKDPKDYQEEKLIFGACGGASIWRKEVFNTVGYLDEDFYAYYEDTDLSFRAQLAGFKCLYVPSAFCYHKGSATFEKDSPKMRFIGNRNKDWVVFKNYPLKYLIIKFPKLVLTKIKSLLTDMRQGLFSSGVKANLAVLSSLSQTLKKRKIIQKQRVVSSKYLNSVISNSHPKLKKG